MNHPRTPLGAIRLAWAGPNRGQGHPIAEVNGDVISSNTSQGILKRFETWIRRHNIGAKGNEIVVTLKVCGNKCIVLTPENGRIEMVSGFNPRWIQNFVVKLWNGDEEFDCLTLDMRTMIWDRPFKKKRKITSQRERPSA